ncbi:hypothetical protein HX99_05290 [Peptococcaceae bacterium SCADC1_2_3]|nr:hypothetical protein DK28_0202115 [Peptococcaceae bacterium SCADC1_2_3]KFI35482.1 hypothetical protein HY00_04695 [Peptococcaceae bacterium SCADC1_2_3]KFI36950.1 hypothetical protein HX99_05290 [Peptococcaceae bacterium SCADC1_2_3]KFI37856.1 hypothetical protein HY02_01965 [Peptococcaceae bacterium SCADC1_2_3]HBQ28017.1 DUF421 domain-containing protein [Desulfotomaculum sp.]
MNPFLEILIRGIGAFILILLVTRLVGKTQVGQLTVSDFVNAIVIGSIGAAAVTDLKESGWYYVFGLLLFGLLTIGAEYLAMKYRPARKLLEGEPTVIIHNGKILEDNMRKLVYHVDDLTMQLRDKGVFNIADVEFAVLEPNGKLSVLLKSQKQPLTPQDLQLPTRYQGIPSEMIIDGIVIQQNLKQNNLTEEWLYQELEKQGIKSVQEVMYASLDTEGKLYVDKRQDIMAHVTDITDKLPGKMPQ